MLILLDRNDRQYIVELLLSLFISDDINGSVKIIDKSTQAEYYIAIDNIIYTEAARYITNCIDEEIDKNTALNVKDISSLYGLNYDKTVNDLIKKYSNFAYNMEETTRFYDVYNPAILNVVGEQNHKIYCYIDKWDGTGRDFFYISESTYELLLYEYPEYITDVDSTLPSAVKHNYYHDVVIKMGLFSRIPQFKKLKLLFMKYNNEIFDNKIDHRLIMMIGKYKDGTNFSDLTNCGGYSSKERKIILLRADMYSMHTIDTIYQAKKKLY